MALPRSPIIMEIFMDQDRRSSQFECEKNPERQKGSLGRGTMGFKLINDSSGFIFSTWIIYTI